MKKYHYYLRLFAYILAVIITPHTMHAATEIERTIELARLITECDADTFHEQLKVYQQESPGQQYRQTTAQLKELALQLATQKQETCKKRLQKTGKRVFSGFSGMITFIFCLILASGLVIKEKTDIKKIMGDICTPQGCMDELGMCWRTPMDVRFAAIEALLLRAFIAWISTSVGYKAVVDLHYAWYANTQKLTEEIKSLRTIIEDLQW